ncbi:epidermal growth factor receptor substrate 15-like [Mangifera indica]|uniref:epidermal growth factor receptor substrate 15-like n=1 Tax=Mangifera indica TaxID=29780 RepID=UPI001CFA003E|nr:epidermal growth factor receptor substrate 15-like [Mangifera indica]XP_044510292.1 epidermal growth factor receptor substrate 15-like [Mangifera indica]
MAGANSAADQFEAYFRRADLDGDGRINGAEAVAFFQGSNLPKQVLAQIWTLADQSHTGFLGRQEFYNALKLVTVAQSKRVLTPDIVKAALYGPAAAKIPPPQINLAAISAQQIPSMAAASTPQISVPTPTLTPNPTPTPATTPMGSQNFGFRGPGVPNVSTMQQSPRPVQAAPHAPQVTDGPDLFRGGSVVGQTQTMSAGIPRHPSQPMPGDTAAPSVPNSNISSDWLSSGKTAGLPTGPRAVSPSTSSSALNSLSLVSPSSQPLTNDSKGLAVSGNGSSSESSFGGDVFAAITPTVKQEPASSTFSAGSLPVSSASIPVSRVAQPPANLNSLDSSQGAFSMQPAGSQFQRTQSLNPPQQVSSQSSSSFSSAGISVGLGNSIPDNSQLTWPKMKPSDVQKYTKVFIEVDTDRDGRITGEQARNLFMSWKLPREVLKQVWDLSDQDSDSMLSLREFCFALYLMERYREGRPLPAVLPRNVMFDETLLSMTGQSNPSFGNASWGASPGFSQRPVMGLQPMTPGAGLRPPVLVTAPNVDSAMMFNQQKSRAPELGDPFANQLDNGEYNSANSKLQEATASRNKVDEPEKVILDSREKIEFYRTKMQELVLYKSRCDNRLNEITERALADKREAESLGKKYEEKYKQVADIASKLTIEEAKFRELQERKMELHQAIVNMEQGGSADGILQVRADRIQSDLEELLKALTERCKKHGVDFKSSALIELPFGWQPGIQEGAAVWDEEWDKFEDEGFGNELTFEMKNASASPNEKASANGSLTHDYLSSVDEKPKNVMNTGEHVLESESTYTHSEDDLARSPHGSPAGRSTLESPSKEFSDGPFDRSTEADAETHRSFDDATWGAFDNNDDVDSVWGFNPKGSGSDSQTDFFGSSDFGVNPIRTGSPSVESSFQKKSPFTFDDSVPATPVSRFGNSPPRYSDASGFDSFTKFDSFSMHDGGFSKDFGNDKFSRFDSINSSRDFGNDKFSRFDSINSSRDFGNDKFSNLDSSRDFGHEKLARFDSINSTKDFGNSQGFYSFDDTDPFGAGGSFKVSFESNPKDGFSSDSSSKDKFSLDNSSKEKF